MKMNLKSVLALLLAAVMLLGLCGCGGDADADADVDASVSPSPEVVETGDPNLYYARVDGTRYYTQPASEPDAIEGNFQSVMAKGTAVTKVTTDGEWIQVNLPTGITAWVHSWFLECDDPETERMRKATLLKNRVSDEDYEPLNAQTYTCMANELNCRSEPHTGGIVFCQIGFGEELTVYGKNNGFYLCEMKDGSIVYCSADYLSEQATYVELAGAVDLRVLMPGADFKLQLSTTDNVIGEALYPAVPLLEQSTADMLMEAYELFDQAGYTIKIYDAYRPASAQDKLESAVDFAGNNDMHSLGRAVDISLVDRASGKELRMPTKVHDFSEAAARTSSDSWEWTLKNNVDYMTGIMESVGFKTIDNEWWHFENPGTTGIDTELDYDALTYIPISQYGTTPAVTDTQEGAE